MKFERTATLLLKQIEENPENALPHLYLCNSYASMNKYEEALGEALTAIRLAEAHNIIHRQYLKAYFTAARVYIQMQRLDDAEEVCRHAVARYGDHIDIFATEAIICLFKKDWSGVMESGWRYREALERYRKHEGGLDMVEIATFGEEWKICSSMGKGAVNLGDIEGAEELFQKAYSLAPDKALLCREAGDTFSAGGHVEKARFYSEEARRISAARSGSHHRDGSNLNGQEAGSTAEAAPKALSTGLRISRDNGESFFQKGMALERAGRLREAEIAYRETIARNNSHVGAFNNLAGILLRSNKDHEALKILQGASSNAINHPALSYSLGLVHSVLGNFSEALNHFDKTLLSEPGFRKVNIQKAVIFLKTGDFRKAVKCLKSEIESGGDVISSLLTLGEISLRMGDRTQARHYFQEVIAVDPDNIVAAKHLNSI